MKSIIIGLMACAVLAVTLAACGDGGEQAAKEKMMQDSVRQADSIAKAELVLKAKLDSLAALPKTIAESTVGTTSTLIAEAGLAETLRDSPDITLFAPSDEAFGEVLDKVDAWRADKAKLATAIKYHVIQGKFAAADLKDGMKLKTMQGEEVKISVKDGKVFINDAEVTTPDKTATNGYIHIINKVLVAKKI